MLSWMAQPPDLGWLREQRFAVIGWEQWRARFVVPARASPVERATIDNPAASLFARYRSHFGVALLDVRLDDLESLRDLLGYALEPAWRAGCRLIVHADRTLEQLDPGGLCDDGFGYPWTLERARYRVGVMTRAADGPRPMAPTAVAARLDAEQVLAVGAHDGVVQVVAPAGSGKTTVLIERVRELLRRGTSASRILCVTFNALAADELRGRLVSAGIAGVRAQTFHSLGRALLQEEGLLSGEPRTRSLAQWRRLAGMAQREAAGGGVWIDPADAQAQIAGLKLGRLLTAAEWRQRAPDDPQSRTLATLYGLYEQELRSESCHDFDDQIFLAVRALRADTDLRARWQGRFDRVLVDEYQDIEPAQELLVQILAAPQDSLFVVGDPDQLLYGWRRASAARIIALDQTFPGLQRTALATNYRCPTEVVARSAQLIAHNTIRFPQQIRAAPGRGADTGVLELREEASHAAAAAWVARQLASGVRGEVVVLARTTRLLRIVAEACVAPAIKISAPAEVFERRGAPEVIAAHLQLAAHPDVADPRQVRSVLRHPSRGLPPDGEVAVAQALRSGRSWADAVRPVADRSGRLADAAAVLDDAYGIEDAVRFVRALRTRGGLDRHFEEHERAFGGAEQTALESLDDSEREARGLTVTQYAARLRDRHAALQSIRDDAAGIELTTVHRAKGREWPTVVIFAFDDDQLPHQRALDVTPEARAAGEGLEAERRVAYVAMTRAKDRLHILTTTGRMSPFAWQAGLATRPPPSGRASEPRRSRRPTPSGSDRPTPGPSHRRTTPPRDLASQIEAISRVGAKYAVRTAADQRTGLRVAAWAIRHRLVNADNVAGTISARAYLGAVPAITDDTVADLLRRAAVEGETVISAMPDGERRRLADALDAAATDPAR